MTNLGDEAATYETAQAAAFATPAGCFYFFAVKCSVLVTECPYGF